MHFFTKSIIILAGGLSLFHSAIAGGIKAYPMTLKNVEVGVPSLIHVENISDSPNTLTAVTGSDNMIVYPPVIENIQPGQKLSFHVAYKSNDKIEADTSRNYVLISIADGGAFKINVRQ